MSGNPRIVLWCGTGDNQRALANKIAERFGLSGIVLDHKKAVKKLPLRTRLLGILESRIIFKSILQAWFTMQRKYAKQFPQWPPNVTLKEVDSINSDEAFEFTNNLHPALVVVSGTSLLKAKMLSMKLSIGIINLHTGLSPYIKGGPNCTNWCISTGEFDKIGNTIMWINKGIDAGDIITSERTPFQTRKDLSDVQWQVMEHAHDLYLRAINHLLKNSSTSQSVPQKSIGEGKLFLTRMWNFKAKKELVKNLPQFLKMDNSGEDNSIVTVPLKATIDE
jgi:folate-dependent phosphoribosylglycinamide formyltransferase PurN